MKKIFWTSIVWICIIVLFWLYIKLFNQNIAAKVSSFISSEAKEQAIEDNSWDNEDMLVVSEHLSDIQDKLENILQTLWGQTAITEKISTWVLSK